MAEKINVDALLDIDKGSERGLRKTASSTVKDEERRFGTSNNNFKHIPLGNTTAFEATSTVETNKHCPGSSKNDFEHLPSINTIAFKITSIKGGKKHHPGASKNVLEHLEPINTTAFQTETMRAESLQLCSPMKTMSMRRNEPTPHPDDNFPDITELTDCLNSLTAQLEYQDLDTVHEDNLTDRGTNLWKSFLEILGTSIAVVHKQLSTSKGVADYLQQKIQMYNGENFRDLEAHWIKLVSDIEKTELEWAHLNVQVTNLQKLIQELALERQDMLIHIEENIQDIKVYWVKLLDKNHEIGSKCTLLVEKMKAYEMANPECIDTE